MSNDYKINRGANCWLKNVTDPKGVWNGVSIAVLGA